MKRSRSPLLPPALLALAATLGLPAHAANRPAVPPPAPCGCDDLTRIENELEDQEYMGNLFAEWAGYLPDAVQDHNDMQERAAALLQLTFYGAKSQAPRVVRGAHADLGTLFRQQDCPLVLYEYKDGRPVMTRDPAQTRVRKGEKLKLIQKATPIDEASYPANGQCVALVHYGFVHEQHHQNTCNTLFKSNKVHLWDNLQFFANDDAEAYRAGADVLRAERDGLRKKCDPKPDGKWHGTITYGWLLLDEYKGTIEKGQDIVWPQATGWQRYGNQKSKRLRAPVTAESLNGSIKVVYMSNFEWNLYDKGHLEYLDGECGWRTGIDFFHDSGQEKHTVLSMYGTTDADISSDGRRVSFSMKTDLMSGTYTERNWDFRTGHCNKRLDKRIDKTHSEPDAGETIGFTLDGAVDPAHPNEIHITKVSKASNGKERTFIELRLRRDEP